MPAAKLRLKEVRVQPVFVLDDGENLVDVVYGVNDEGQKITDHVVTVIPAAEWPTYSSERFPREVAEWQARIDEEAATPTKVKAERAKRKPAKRRKK